MSETPVESPWAFGAAPDPEDVLAGVDTRVPEGVDATRLAELCLALGDDALVLAHRLSEWCSNAPDLEDDIALANVALDLLGQARLLLARAAAADPGLVGRLVPGLPAGSPALPEDALAFFRDPGAWRCTRFVEVENGDFAQTITRLAVFATVRLAASQRLVEHPDPVLAAVAAKAVKELAYHRDHAGRWFLVLAQGTEESRRRLLEGLRALWPLHDELARAYDLDGARAEAEVVLDQLLAVSAVERPAVAPYDGPRHTDDLTRLLAEMQSVARAHPLGVW